MPLREKGDFIGLSLTLLQFSSAIPHIRYVPSRLEHNHQFKEKKCETNTGSCDAWRQLRLQHKITLSESANWDTAAKWRLNNGTYLSGVAFFVTSISLFKVRVKIRSVLIFTTLTESRILWQRRIVEWRDCFFLQKPNRAKIKSSETNELPGYYISFFTWRVLNWITLEVTKGELFNFDLPGRNQLNRFFCLHFFSAPLNATLTSIQLKQRPEQNTSTQSSIYEYASAIHLST